MLDQSFSGDNFRKILDYENRKGIYLIGKFFPDVNDIVDEIKTCIAQYHIKKGTISKARFPKFKEKFERKKEVLIKEKDEKLEQELNKVSENIYKSNFKINLNQVQVPSGKHLYTIPNNPENYFILKQVLYNFKRLYKVKQANRFNIVNQIKCILEDKFPKYVIRTDISNFYESIPHDILTKKLNDNLLTHISKSVIDKILKEYKLKSGSTKGLPRGIGISAYLSELYMRDIDSDIKALPHLIYYARYVDDIIAIFTPITLNDKVDYKNDLKQIIEKDHKLKLNETKTFEYDLISNSNNNKHLEYLGYKISFGGGSVKVTLSSSKIDKYKKRIDLTFQSYLNLSKIDEKKARKLLIKRVRFLTGNTRLLNNKKNILVGVYFNNCLLTNSDSFKSLDQYLRHKINKEISVKELRKRLREFNFIKGFEEKKFFKTTSEDLLKILQVWKHEKQL
jgi:hypothetical protein